MTSIADVRHEFHGDDPFEPACSVRSRIASAIDQQFWPVMKPACSGAEKGAIGAELGRTPVAPGRDWPRRARARSPRRSCPLAASMPRMCSRCASLSKMPGSRLLMVTLRATVCRASPATKPDQAGARAVRQPELELRNLHAARDDVDDAAEAARHHAVDREPHHLDRAEHHRVERGDPVVARPVAEVAGQRAVGVVEQDVRLRDRRRAPPRGPRRGDIAGNRA